MKLFDGFEAVRFPEEDLIYVTDNSFIYYVYNPKYKNWRRHSHAGFERITVSNYQDITREEFISIMGGKFPTKDTDFMRLCDVSYLTVGNMMRLLDEDYPAYMSDRILYHSVHKLLLRSNISFKSYLRLRDLFDVARANQDDNQQVFNSIKELSIDIIGRDIYKKEIEIIDGHDSSSYFWIMPVRVIDYSNSYAKSNVAEMRSAEISIEEDDVDQFLSPFLYKYFDGDLKANKSRWEFSWTDDDGVEQFEYIKGFEWYLTYNFYTFESINDVIKDIRETIEALSTGKENDYTKILRKKRGMATYEIVYARDFSEEQINEYNANRPKEDDTEVELIIDFYQRFIYRIEYMMKVGEENGYNLISFMGP